MYTYFTCLSDLHGNLPYIGDNGKSHLLLAGDIVPLRLQNDHDASLRWLKGAFNDWIERCKFKSVTLTWGNHDFVGLSPSIANELIDIAEVVIDDCIDIEGIKIWLSPWSKTFGQWAFMKDDHELREIYDRIPDDADIIISHCPPQGYGDVVYSSRPEGTNEGSISLLYRLVSIFDNSQKDIVCLNGHIHGGAGFYEIKAAERPYNRNHPQEDDSVRSGIRYLFSLNCSILDDNYVKNNNKRVLTYYKKQLVHIH